ncbi:alanine--tRNA ligase [bacterium (Candidatus Gribaldobacteria) CG08_land_8_20_14_0_20_39_15]|uniref:Alanine--tRNA ligase n=1 Tax=bacterium (Candidatus Gribaldobacteria) CG08_land_8_20_14_0_20_39_15 TaxID=2014273 RepID=A0A2M6XU24_9BACT|nr:MAG: alanine--tRNA ligase [bacterium (Candidatus Gribaldobacteria) CG08_land_8_20_14_0_20_39_15]
MLSDLTAKELREKYLKFFEKKGHKIIPSAPLIPENDPTVLFTTAGMHPLVPYLLGETHPLGRRLVNSQKCIRTNDIDDVGDATHLTFFEMLGNWSLGDYFKREAIEWSFEFLTKELNIPLGKLAFTVFEGLPGRSSEGAKDGEEGIPKDTESYEIWQCLGVSEKKIKYLGREDNWWGPAGKTGPCGPDTEMFYWTGDISAPAVFEPTDKRWVEIWNNVFMQYNKQLKVKSSKLKVGEEEYEFVALGQKNVDTGMGLERVAAILQGKGNVYETELFQPIIENVKILMTNVKSNPNDKMSNEEKIKALRIIADHIKTSTFILAEGLAPSNVGRGYVLRRLIRRTVRYGKLLGIEKEFCAGLTKEVIKIYDDIYPELKENQDFIFDELEKEEKNFGRTLERGLKELKKAIEKHPWETDFVKVKQGIESSVIFNAFYFYQTFGFPIELIKEEFTTYANALLFNKGLEIIVLKVWEEIEKVFYEDLKEHQDLSRTAAVGQFKSGLADNSEQTTKYHTATHLLLAALREILGKEVQQKGSNITAERIRFDFNFGRKMTAEEIKKVEDLINEKIKADLPVICEEMETDQAFEKGAVGVFGHKYADKVKVYTIGKPSVGSAQANVCSKEICAGPHVARTGLLGNFKIIKEESSSSGVRRIKAVLE